VVVVFSRWGKVAAATTATHLMLNTALQSSGYPGGNPT
jgi:hypothetical protein